MAKIIFILGAGASKVAGAPLMNEFLDKARELWRTNKVPAEAQYFEQVFNAVSILQRAPAKAQLDIHNVESVFSAFEMASVLHSLGECTIERIRDLAPAMRIVIAKTIEKTFVYGAIHRLNTADVLPGNYEHFEPFVIRLHQLYSTSRPDYGFGFITFNYDLALDLMFEHLGIEADYGLERTPNANA